MEIAAPLNQNWWKKVTVFFSMETQEGWVVFCQLFPHFTGSPHFTTQSLEAEA